MNLDFFLNHPKKLETLFERKQVLEKEKKRIKVVVSFNFSLPIAPKDFKIHKKPHHLTKTIFIGLALGRINLLLPGQETILGDAYKKH